MYLLNLFPTDVYIEKNNEIDNKKISKIILEKEKIKPSMKMSNQGGWQSSDYCSSPIKIKEQIKS